jgi:heme oxygenase (biliverdin-IX-beta and delta-forming)
LNPTHKALRAGTAEAHDRVDTAFAAFDLADRESYAAFLQAHAEVLLPLEEALDAAGAEALVPDWPDRKRGALLVEDLAFLRPQDQSGDSQPLLRHPQPPSRHPREGGDPESQAVSSANLDTGLRGEDEWELASPAQIAGALYVVEGSRLGGRFLARQLPRGFPRAYLDADQASEKWRNLLDRLEPILYQPDALQSALGAAHHVFSAFERSARRWARG